MKHRKLFSENFAFHFAQVSDRAALAELDLPDHWMRYFFLAHCYLELLLNNQAIGIYRGLQKCGLKDSTYIMAQLAIAHHNKRDLDEAVSAFKVRSVFLTFLV